MSDQSAQLPAVVLPAGRRTIVLLVILLAFFMDLLDTTIVNVAIPSIRTNLGASYASVQWIIAGYQLAFALVLITGGRLGDIFGYRTIFVTGMALFTLASALCGFAQTTEMLIASRLLQGVGAALMVPQILSTIQVMYISEERANVSAFYGALAGLAAVSGPIVGALLITGNVWGLGWRTIFLVNVPVGIFATVAAFFLMPKVKSPHPLRLDLVGVGLTVIALLFLMYPLIQGRELDWPQWTYWMMAASIPVFLIFAFDQVRKGKRNGSPLVEPSLFQTRSFVAGLGINAAMFGVVAGFFLMFTIFLQIGLGYTVLKAGLSGIPFSIGIAITAGAAGPVFVPWLGRWSLTIGALVMAIGIGVLSWAVWHFGGDLSPWEMIPGLFLAGAGMGMVVAPIVVFILAEVPIRTRGLGFRPHKCGRAGGRRYRRGGDWRALLRRSRHQRGQCEFERTSGARVRPQRRGHRRTDTGLRRVRIPELLPRQVEGEGSFGGAGELQSATGLHRADCGDDRARRAGQRGQPAELHQRVCLHALVRDRRAPRHCLAVFPAAPSGAAARGRSGDGVTTRFRNSASRHLLRRPRPRGRSLLHRSACRSASRRWGVRRSSRRESSWPGGR